jgi:uncharacterized integral membrane protein
MRFSRRKPADPPAASDPASAVDEDPIESDPAQQVPLTRAGAAWVGVSTAAVIATALIIFLVQNTQRVAVSFLWMTTSTSLALMLLIAAVGGIFITVVLGTARIVQLRRLVRGRSKS